MKLQIWLFFLVAVIAAAGCRSKATNMSPSIAPDSQIQLSGDAVGDGVRIQADEAVHVAWLHVQDVLKVQSEYRAQVDESENEWSVTFINLVPRRRGGGAKVIVSAATGKVTHVEYYQ